MQFLVRHLEKLLLGLALAGLLATCYYLLSSLQAADTKRTRLKTERDLAVSAADSRPKIAPATAAAIDLQTRDLAFAFAPARGEGGPLEPGRYILCVNKDCNRILAYSAETCPFCRTPQPPEPPDLTAAGDEDYDRDGIPDYVEERYHFLRRDNPRDAFLDYDGDGFTNVEEYRAKTEMDNPESFPSLAHATRFIAVSQKRIPVVLRRVSGGDDKSRWDIAIKTMDGQRERNRQARIGDEFEGYRIDDASKPAGDKPATMTLVRVADNERYLLAAEEIGKEREYQARLIFLAYRDPQRIRRLQPKDVKQGDTFDLTHPITKAVQTFTVDRLTDTEVIVKGLDADGQRMETVQLRRFNPRQDVVPGVGFWVRQAPVAGRTGGRTPNPEMP